MPLTLHTLKPASGSKIRKFRIGRGDASGRGKTSGRGTKGQRARTGGRNKLKLRGMKRMLLRIPKSRGFTSAVPHPYAITLDQLERWCQAGEKVTLAGLQKRNLAPRNVIGFKVLNTGTLTKPLTLVGAAATPAAKAAVEKAGGKFESTAPVKKTKTVVKKAAKK